MRPRGKPFVKGNKFGPRFKKGESGNPGGRPKRKLLSEAYKAVLEADDITAFQPATVAESIAHKTAEEALKGRIGAASEIADRVEGKPRQAYDAKLSIMDELAERIDKRRKRVEELRKNE